MDSIRARKQDQS